MSTINVNEQQIYYTDTEGNGPAVVFSHGALLDSSIWDETIRALVPDFRGIAWDARLHGQTPGTGPAHTDWDSARDLLALLDALGINRAVLAGHSQGGFISLRAALLAPSRVSGLVLIDTMATAWPPESIALMNGARDGFAAAGPDAVAPELLPRLIGRADLYDTWLARWRAQGSQRLAVGMQVLMSADDVSSRLAEVTAPALVIHGEADPIIPLEAGRGLNSSLVEAGELIVVPSAATHTPVLTHPDIVIPAVKKFLDEH
jgi:3-oxoadipate enol-lactonase